MFTTRTRSGIQGVGLKALAGQPVLRSVSVMFGVLLALLLVSGCGGGDDGEATVPEPGGATGGAAGGATGGAGGTTAVSVSGAAALQGTPFELNQQQVVPPDFRAAYQRQALVVVQFYRAGQGEFYPQGLEVDDMVDRSVEDLSSGYPTVEFFSYDITNPGNAQSSEGLEQGQYGTLAAQLGVGFTPYVAMLAPRDGQYYYESVFQGYVPREVLDQALFDLTSLDAGGNISDTDVVLGTVELTETGDGVEYFTVRNQSQQSVNLQGFSLQALDPDTGEVDDSGGLLVDGDIRVRAGSTVAVGRAPDVVGARGNRVAGTFTDEGDLTLSPGSQVALLDSGGAVAATFTL